MKSRRQLRLAEQIKRSIGLILERGAKDPRIGFVSVTGVELSADLRNAQVFVSIFGDEEEVQKTLQGLQSARSYIQRELGEIIRSRYTPLISFHLDQSTSYGTRIDQVIEELRRQENRLLEKNEGDKSPS